MSLPLATVASEPGMNVPLQVRVISISNTLSRFLFGFMADIVSPAAVSLAPGVIAFPRTHYISRVFFLGLGAVILAASLAWMLVAAESQQTVWVLR